MGKDKHKWDDANGRRRRGRTRGSQNRRRRSSSSSSSSSSSGSSSRSGSSSNSSRYDRRAARRKNPHLFHHTSRSTKSEGPHKSRNGGRRRKRSRSAQVTSTSSGSDSDSSSSSSSSSISISTRWKMRARQGRDISPAGGKTHASSCDGEPKQSKKSKESKREKNGDKNPPALVSEECSGESGGRANGRTGAERSPRPRDKAEKKNKNNNKKREKERKRHKKRKRKSRATAGTAITVTATTPTADACDVPYDKRRRRDPEAEPLQRASTGIPSSLPAAAAPTSAGAGSKSTADIRRASLATSPVLASASGGGGGGSGGGGVDDAARAEKARSMVPMRPEEYAAQQRTVREVFDEDTGRWRLVKGTGEIIERIVSREEQQEIQQHASRWGWDHKVLFQASSSSAGAAAAKPPIRH